MPKKVPLDKQKLNQIVTDARKHQTEREQSYRGQALEIISLDLWTMR
jgi:hypothetical protein